MGFNWKETPSPFDGRVSRLSCNRSSPRHGRSGSLIGFASTTRRLRVQPKSEFRRFRFWGDRCPYSICSTNTCIAAMRHRTLENSDTHEFVGRRKAFRLSETHLPHLPGLLGLPWIAWIRDKFVGVWIPEPTTRQRLAAVDKILERNSSARLTIRAPRPPKSARRRHSRGDIEARRLVNDGFSRASEAQGPPNGHRSPSQSVPTSMKNGGVRASLVRGRTGGGGIPFYGAQPLQSTQTRAPTGERLQKMALDRDVLGPAAGCAARHDGT